MKTNILLIADTIENHLLPSCADLAAAANRLLPHATGPMGLVLPGRNVQAAARKAVEQYGMDATVIEHTDLYLPNPPLLLTAIRQIIQKHAPDFILLPHTLRACGMAAALAHDMDAACITAVENIRKENNTILFQRSVFNGKLLINVSCRSPRAVLTILPGAFPSVPPMPEKKPGRIERYEIPGDTDNYKPLRLIAASEKDDAMENADVIVAAGHGIGTEENLALIRNTAALFKNGAVAGSRTVCDLGWLPYARQIGETGQQVAPKLYIACGISGARQHTVGMKNAQTVVAVNTDPHAAIFAVADYGIVEDLTTFLPLLVNKP